jgi:hypothetical protein
MRHGAGSGREQRPGRDPMSVMYNSGREDSPGPYCDTHSLPIKALLEGGSFFSPTELYWLFFPILPRCDCRLSAWASGRDEGWYPGCVLIAFSPTMANRRMAEARVGRSGSSLR